MLAQSRYVILAAVAFDESGMNALHEAARCAQLRPDAELHLVHVLSEETASGAASELLALNAKLLGAPEQLRRLVDMLGLDRPFRVTAHLRAGQPSDCILQTAVDLDADLLVVGTRKRRGMEKLIFGSSTERVLRHAHCPVLVAMPKNHLRSTHTGTIDPPCTECLSMRCASSGNRFWCERHARTRMLVHIYEPSAPQTPVLVR